MKMIPGVAIGLQVSFENFFNGMYGTSPTVVSNNGTVAAEATTNNATTASSSLNNPEVLTSYGLMCSGGMELRLRTVAFAFILLVGWSLMKWRNYPDQRLLFHAVINVVLVPSWLLSVSAYPLACWVAQPDGTLTADDVKVASFVRFFLVTLVAPFLVGLEINKDSVPKVPTAIADAYQKLTRKSTNTNDATGDGAAV